MNATKTNKTLIFLKNNLSIFLIYLFVFLTGASGLIYEVVWQKYLGRLLGSDTVGIAIIIGTFLGGLSIGYFLCGRLSSKVKNHLKVYAFLELIIAVWCMFFPAIFDIFYSLTLWASFKAPYLLVLQGIAGAFILTGVPTICMGATVPMLTRGISPNLEKSTKVHAKIYGTNTFGAFAGTILAGFFLIPFLGLPISIMMTSLINLLAFFVFYALGSLKKPLFADSGGSVLENSIENTPKRNNKRIAPVVLYLVAFLSGFYIMIIENVLIRVTNLSFGSSSYSFSIILGVFLIALSAGSFIAGKLNKISIRILFYNQLLTAFFLLLVFFAMDEWPYISHLLRITFQSSKTGFIFFNASIFITLFLLLFIPLLFAGATLPLIFHEIKRRLTDVGRHSGYILSANTFGCLLGSLAGGVVLYEIMDMQGIFTLAITFCVLSTLLTTGHLSLKYKVTGAVSGLFILLAVIYAPFFDASRFENGVFRERKPMPYSFDGPKQFFKKFASNSKTLYHKDGPALSVSVTEIQNKRKHPELESRSIIVNGKSDSNTYYDIYTVKLSAHISSLLARQRKSAFIVGFGTGMTVGEIALYDEYKKIDVAEISQSVVDALPFFTKSNNDIKNDPRLNIHPGDAFRVLGRSNESWDVVISEPSNPWVMGVDLLYTKEFYELVKKHLSKGGIFLQWIHVYAASEKMVGMVVGTLKRSFKDVHVFLGSASDLLLVSSMTPFTRDDILAANTVWLNNPKVKKSLEQLDIHSIDSLLLRQIWNGEYIKDMYSDFGMQTLDNPRLHYLAGQDFFMGNTLSAKRIFSFEASFYRKDFLLYRKYPLWDKKTLNPDEIQTFAKSLKGDLDDKYFPIAPYLSLKSSIQNPDNPHPFLKRIDNLDTSLLIQASNSKFINNFNKLSLDELKEKTKLLVDQVEKHRKWLTPFSLDGLKKLLEMMINKTAKEEKNYYILLLARYLVLENAAPLKIQKLFSLATWNGEDIKVDYRHLPLWHRLKSIINSKEKYRK